MHNWQTIGLIIIMLVPEDSKCSNKYPLVTPFLDQMKLFLKKSGKYGIIKTLLVLTIRTILNDSRLVQLFGLWSSHY